MIFRLSDELCGKIKAVCRNLPYLEPREADLRSFQEHVQTRKREFWGFERDSSSLTQEQVKVLRTNL